MLTIHRLRDQRPDRRSLVPSPIRLLKTRSGLIVPADDDRGRTLYSPEGDLIPADVLDGLVARGAMGKAEAKEHKRVHTKEARAVSTKQVKGPRAGRS